MGNDLTNRRGKIIIDRDFVLGMEESMASAFFSRFYPIAMESSHDVQFYGHLVYYGNSPDFRKVEEGEECPEYGLQITLNDRTGEITVRFKEKSNIIKYKYAN